MKQHVLAITIGAALLVGCNSTPVEELSYTEKKALTQKIIARCIEQGIPADSAELKPCAMSELDREIATRHSNKQRRMAAGAAMMNMGNQMQANANAGFATRPVNCTSTATSTWVGGAPRQVNTTCY